MNAHTETHLILKFLIFSELSTVNQTSNEHPINWLFLYKLILRHRVWHQVKHRFLSLSQDSGAQQMVDALAEHCQQDKQRILVTAGETVRISRAFTQQCINHCFIKGILLNVYLYGALDTRPCRDIDVWVDLNTYTQAVNILLSLGYEKQLPVYDLTGFKKSYYMRNMHDMAFYHPTRHVLVELHFRLSYFGIQFFSFSEVQRKTIELFQVPVTTLDDDYHLLYLMLHGAIHAWIRLRWLYDIVLFIQSKRCNLDRVYELAKQIHCEHLVEQTLIIVHDLFSLHDDSMNIFIQNSSIRSIQLAQIAKQFIMSDYEMTDGLRNPILFFKYRWYLSKLAAKGQKMHAIVGDLFKIDKLFPYVTFHKSLFIMYYLCYPFWVLTSILKSFRRAGQSSR